MSHTVEAVWLNVYTHTDTVDCPVGGGSPILSQMLIRSVRSARSTNSFYPLTLSALRPFPGSPALPVSPAPLSADRHLPKTHDCTDNTHKVEECRSPQRKTETPLQKKKRIKKGKAKPTGVSCDCLNFLRSLIVQIKLSSWLSKKHPFFFFSPPPVS